jgi:hypothetical protein
MQGKTRLHRQGGNLDSYRGTERRPRHRLPLSGEHLATGRLSPKLCSFVFFEFASFGRRWRLHCISCVGANRKIGQGVEVSVRLTVTGDRRHGRNGSSVGSLGQSFRSQP